MAFDAYYLKAVLAELSDRLLGGRVEKLHQPSRDTVILLIRGRESREKLLIALNPAAPRLHLTAQSPENPAQPPMFCMLLRKHLSGARLVKIHQPPMERMAVFTFDCIDELGDPVQKQLVAELMGRTCNLYLLGPEGRIIDCLRRVGIDEVKRPALPGLYYQYPEKVAKQDPAALTVEDYVNLLSSSGADLLCDRLMDTLGGLSPLVCREAALYACGETDARLAGREIPAAAEKLACFFQEVLEHPAPWYTADATGTPKQFAFCPIRQYGECFQGEDFSTLLDRFYRERNGQDALRQKSQTVRKTVQNLIQRITRKLAIQQQEYAATLDRERLRQLGDILTANLHKMVKGQTQVEVEDFYDEEMKTITVSLSPLLSPQQNAAKYYKDYSRMKNAQRELGSQMEIGQRELEYLKSVLEELNRAKTEAEVEEIRRELEAGGYIKTTGQKRMKQGKLPPMRFESTDGYPIYVGRNNLQNEELTFKSARKDDIWCHASKVHGSHVVIACGGTQPPDNTLTQAAQLAAYYSEAGAGQNVAVDMTQIRQVKKAPGAKPGMVIYHTYKTVIANPYPDIVLDKLNAE